MQREVLHLRLPSFPLQLLCGDKRIFLSYPMVLCSGDLFWGRSLISKQGLNAFLWRFIQHKIREVKRRNDLKVAIYFGLLKFFLKVFSH